MRLTPTFSLAPILAIFLVSCGARKEGPKTFDLGSRVEIGHLVYTVFETQWLPQIGSGDSARIPKNRFFLIRISAVNSGSEDILVPNMVLEDDSGNTVEELSDGDQVPQWMGYVRKVKPADTISGNIVFDAPPKHYRIHLTDEDGEKVALVDLPLNFNGEAPDVPTSTGAPGAPGKN